MLATFVMKKQPISLRDRFYERLEPMLLQDPKNEFTHLFPAFFDNNNNRDSWDPSQFTDPVTLRAFLNPEDWTVRPPPAYKLMIHTVRKGTSVLQVRIPELLLRGFAHFNQKTIRKDNKNGTRPM